jgi:CrcB protein
MLWIAIAAGGALGSMIRHGAGVITRQLFGLSGHFGTALVNIAGCLAVGVLAGLAASGGLRLGDNARAFIFVGLLGGFTTFSAFGLETFTLVKAGSIAAAAANVALQVGLGLSSVFVGYWLAGGWGK